MRTRLLLVVLMIAPCLTAAAADQADNAIMAAMQLSAAPNYSWTTTVEQNSGSAVTRGQTTQEGYSLITFNARPPAMASTSGISALAPESGPETATIYKGDSKYVVQEGNSWSLPTKASAVAAIAEPSPTPTSGTGRGNAGTGARGQGMRGGGASGRRGRNASKSGDESTSAGDTVGKPWAPPAALNLPHEELAILAANYTNLQFAGDIVSGKLTESGADLLLLPPGSTQVPPKEASGTFRLWIVNGAVTKYELKLMAKQTPSGHEVKGGFAETVTVEFTDIGSTKFAVPATARQKLGF